MNASVRRMTLTAALLAAGAPLLVGCGPRILRPADYLAEWRTERGNSARTGSIDPDLAPPLELAWTKRIGRGMKGSPVPVGPLVIAVSTDGRVRALLRESGEEAWSSKIRGGFFTAPAVYDRRIYAVSEYPDGALYCIGLERGGILWKRRIGPGRSTPTVDAGVVYVITNDGDLHALDALRGKQLWQNDAAALVPQSPLVLGDSLLLLTLGDSLRTLSTADGRVLSCRPLRHPPRRGELALGTDLYYPSADGIGIRPVGTSAEPVTVGPGAIHVAVGDGVILGTDGVRTAFAVVPPSPEPLWTYATRGLIEAAPIPAGRYAVVASLAGEVRVLDLRDGRVAWETATGAPIPAPPAVSGGWLFVATEKGDLVAFRPRATPANGRDAP